MTVAAACHHPFGHQSLQGAAGGMTQGGRYLF
jgi:hypothetical protein